MGARRLAVTHRVRTRGPHPAATPQPGRQPGAGSPWRGRSASRARVAPGCRRWGQPGPRARPASPQPALPSQALDPLSQLCLRHRPVWGRFQTSGPNATPRLRQEGPWVGSALGAPPPPTAHLGPVAVGELLSEQTADASLQGLHVGVPGGGGDKHTGTLRDEPPLAAATPSARPRGQHRAQTQNAVRQGPLTRVSRRHPRRTPTTPEAPTRSKRGCGQAVGAREGGQGVAGPVPSTSRGPGSRPHSSRPGAS